VDYLFLRASFYFLGVNHIKQELPINEQIRFKEVQVIDEQGQKVGKLPINQALDMATSKDLDLVLVSGNSDNPVCKIMNYGKHKFEQAKREKESRKKQKTVECKELRVTPNIEIHDFTFKAKNARKFLSDGNKVRITVRFRGREVNYVKSGEDVLNKFIEELSDISTVEKKPFLEGKNMFIILAPSK
jgi:translation initiation factor IF-3